MAGKATERLLPDLVSFSLMPASAASRIWARLSFRAGLLYRDPVLVTLGRFPKARESDSTWRTKEVRHVGSDTFAP